MRLPEPGIVGIFAVLTIAEWERLKRTIEDLEAKVAILEKRLKRRGR